MRSLLLLAALAGCGVPGGDAVVPGGSNPDAGGGLSGESPDEAPPVDAPLGQRASGTSSTVQVALDGTTLLVVDPDLGAVDVLRAGADPVAVPVGVEPTRIAPHGGAWFVTVRGEGAVARLVETSDGLVVAAKVKVGAEPYDVVGSAHRDAIYVTLGQESAIVELDPATLQERARWPVDGEPRWLAAAPADQPERLATALAATDRVVELDRTTGTLSTRTFPVLPRFVDEGCKPRDLASRTSGGVVYGPDGELFVGALYADVQLAPVDHVVWREENGLDPEEICEDEGEHRNRQDEPCVTYYGCPRPPPDPRDDPITWVGRFNPAVVAFPRDAEPRALLALGSWTHGAASPDPALDVRGAPSALALDDGGHLWVALDGAGAVVVLGGAPRTAYGSGAFGFRPVVTTAVPAGPVGFARDVGTDTMVVWSGLERRASVVRSPAVADALDRAQVPFDALDLAIPTQSAPRSEVPDDVRRGRTLFTVSTSPLMSAASSGVSCATCHPEGRTDGFTWHFVDFPRSTPSIVGRVDDTVPLGWLGAIPDVTQDVLATTSQRMGGQGLSEADAAKVAAYVNGLRAIQRPDVVDAVALGHVTAGEAAFEAACVSCHPGDAGTDAQAHAVPGGLRIDTPALRGVAATGPWLHDGSASTLAEVLATPHAEGMGPVEVVDDLVAYLATR